MRSEEQEIVRAAYENALYMLREASAVQYEAAVRQAIFEARPSTRYKPVLSIDGDHWCALYGENLQDGVAGFGASPELAMAAFDRAWTEKLPSAPTREGSDE